MCLGGSAPKDNSGAIAAQQQAQQQATIQKDIGEVNDAFSGAFTPDYYNGIVNDYENYYDPQLQTQYQNALNSLTYQLGQQGILQSSEGDRQLGLLKQSYDTNLGTIANNAKNASATAKQNIANQQNALLAQANTAADPTSLATEAASSVASQPPAFNQSVLGNVFAGLLGQGTNALSIQQGGAPVTGQAGAGTFYQNYVTPVATQAGGGGTSGGGGSSYVSN